MRKKDVYLLGATSLLNDISSKSIYFVLPFILKEKLELSIIGGFFNGLDLILKPFVGLLSDISRKRKIFIFLGYSLSFFSRLLILILGGFYSVLFFILDRCGKGIRDSPRDAILGEFKNRKWAYGVQKCMDMSGCLIATFLVFFLIKKFGVSLIKLPILYVVIFFGILSLIPIIFVSDIDSNISNIKVRECRNIKEAFKSVRNNFRFVFLTLMTGFLFLSPITLINISKGYFKEFSIIFFSLFEISYILATIFIATLLNKLSDKNIFLLGYFYLFFGTLFLYSGKFMFLSFIFYGLSQGLMIPIILGVSSTKEVKYRGFFLGFIQMILGSSIILGNFLISMYFESIKNMYLVLSIVLLFLFNFFLR